MLAMAYQANRQVREAISLLEQVVKIREQTQAEDHPSQLNSQHVLAGLPSSTVSHHPDATVFQTPASQHGKSFDS
jgi:hypothetical protein